MEKHPQTQRAKSCQHKQANTMGLHALLIGVNHYLPNGEYNHLFGCVSDVERMETYLKTKHGLDDGNLLKLIASHEGGKDQPVEPPEMWPTYENMVIKFKELTNRAQPGDQVIILYSGHGGRAKTKYPDLKIDGVGLDETLVPTNISQKGARYLRDVELAFLLQQMVDKGLLVTMILDSCHSGGATRGDRVRSIDQPDMRDRPEDSMVAGYDALAANWRQLTRHSIRHTSVGGIPESEGFVIIAACRSNESAYEHRFDGQVASNGALTHYLLDTLYQSGGQLNYQQLHQAVLAKVHSQFACQTPLIFGDGARKVFARTITSRQYAATVMEIDGREVQINAGQAQGIRKGSAFGIYPLTANLENRDDQVAVVRVTQREATDSWAEIVEPEHSVTIEPGDHALLLNPATVRLKGGVKLVGENPNFEQLRALIDNKPNGFVILDESEFDFLIDIDEHGHYVICDSGDKPIPSLRPPIAIADSGSSQRVYDRLVHLTKFRNIQRLANRDSRSPLAGKLRVEFLGKQDDYEPGDEWEPEPITPDHVFQPDEWALVQIKNESIHPLNVTMLALGPDWSVSQIYPGFPARFELFDPGRKEILPFKIYIPDDFDETEAVDILKVFATIGNTDFRLLELPALDKPYTQSGTRSSREVLNPLEELLQSVASTSGTRHARLTASSSHEWVTEQIEIRARRH